jgi:quercetin dioxygenase-like cupin family protein
MRKFVRTSEDQGIWYSVMYLAAGEGVVQHKHKFDHETVVIAGDIVLTVDEKATPAAAPASLLIRAGQTHRIDAATDAVCMCIHRLAPGETIDDILLDRPIEIVTRNGRIVSAVQRLF